MSGIPPNAKRVFSGIIFDIYQWEQEMFDGSRETFEIAKRADSVQIIPVKDGKVLAAFEEQPHRGKFYGLFGGRLDPDEAPLDAAQRELLEETGLISDEWELLTTVQLEGHLHWHIHYYIAHNCRKRQEPSPGTGERIKALELGFEGFLEVALREGFRSQSLTAMLLRMLHEGKIEEFRRRLRV